MLSLYIMMLETEEDKQRFEEIYQDNRKIMYHTANKILQHPQHSEDAVHQAFLKMIEIWKTIKDQTCPQITSLSVIIVRNISLNMKRGNKYREYIPLGEVFDLADSVSTADEALDNVCIEKIMEKVKELPTLYKDAVMLSVGHDMSVEQIAKALKISKDAAKKRIQRGKAQVVALIEKEVQVYAQQ